MRLTFRLRCYLRAFVVLTAKTPLGKLYRSYYQLTIWRTKKILEKEKGLIALYLRRGAAKNEIVPGVSDLDLAAFAHPESIDNLKRRYRSLQQWSPLLEEKLEIYDPEGFQTLAQQPARKYRLEEARQTWSLLAGNPIIEDSPATPLDAMWDGLLREINIWYRLFLDQLFLHPYRRHDRVFANSFCYKFLIELLKFDLAWSHGELVFRRGEVLSRCEHHPWHDTLQLWKRSHFLCPSSEVIEKTWSRAQQWLVKFSRELLQHRHGQSSRPFKNHRIDQPTGSRFSEAEDSVRRYWGETLEKVEFRTCLMFRFCEVVMLLRFACPPDLNRLRDFTQNWTDPIVKPYLWLDRCAVSLAREPVADATVLVYAQNPEIFPSHDPPTGACPSFWSIFTGRATDLSECHDLPAPQRNQRFWASARLALAYLEAKKGRLVVAGGPDSISRSLAGHQFEVPQPLCPEKNSDGLFLRNLWHKTREQGE